MFEPDVIPDPDSENDRAEAYRIFAGFFAHPPDVESLEAIVSDFRLSAAESADDVAADFRRLFASPDGSLQPVESLFIGKNEEPGEDVSSIYADAGLMLDEDYDLPPDHLTFELLFMSYLIDAGKIDLQQQFLDEHLFAWVPEYCDEIARTAGTAFYREIAGILKEFIIMETESFLP